MLAQFYWNPVQHGLDDQGIPVYEDRIFVKITRDSTHTVNREAEDEDYERFPGELKFFEKATAKYEPIKDCLPLEFWPVASPADVMNLKGHGIRSVQELAKKDPAKMPAAFADLSAFAKNYMKFAGDVAKITTRLSELTEENNQLKQDLRNARGETEALRRAINSKAAAA